MKNKTYNKRKILIVFIGASLMILGLIARLCYLMIFDAEYYQKKAEALHEREREIKAARGEIIDRNGKVLATNKTVCTVSVIHSQIEDADESSCRDTGDGGRNRTEKGGESFLYGTNQNQRGKRSWRPDPGDESGRHQGG